MRKKSRRKNMLTSLLLVMIVGIMPGFSVASPINSSFLNLEEHQKCLTMGDPKITAIFEMINETVLRQYLEPLISYAPRFTGTYGCEKSAAFIYNQFVQTGLTARFQNWTAFGNQYHPRRFNSQNVEGTLKGTDPMDDAVILFSAHYDTVKNTQGANDDGSGTAAVLAAAYALSHFTFQRSLKFVTFAGEEEGLLGSHAYAKEAYEQNENIMLNINADMIGHADTADGGRRMRLTLTEDAVWVYDIFNTVSQEYNLGFTLNRGAVNREGRGGSDYFSFTEYGWETLACWEADHDPAMHTSDDDLSNINFSYLVNTTRIIAGTLASLADTEDTYPQVQIESPRFGVLYSNGMEKRSIRDLKTTVINDIWIWADVKFTTAPVERAEFYYDTTLAYTDTEPPFKWNCNIFSLRTHRITIIVYDQLGRKSTDWRDIHLINILLNH